MLDHTLKNTNLTYRFPKNFWWGSAASGPQTEGAAQSDGKNQTFMTTGTALSQRAFIIKLGRSILLISTTVTNKIYS